MLVVMHEVPADSDTVTGVSPAALETSRTAMYVRLKTGGSGISERSKRLSSIRSDDDNLYITEKRHFA